MSSPCRFPKMGVPNHPFKNIDLFIGCSRINYPSYGGFGVPPFKNFHLWKWISLNSSNHLEVAAFLSGLVVHPVNSPPVIHVDETRLLAATNGGLVKPHKNIHLHGVLRPGVRKVGWDQSGRFRWQTSLSWWICLWSPGDSNWTTMVYGTLNIFEL